MNEQGLEEILKTETELVEALLGVLRQQQNAIIHFQSTSLLKLVEQQHSLLRPLEQLERERVKLCTTTSVNGDESVREQKQRLKNLVRQIVEINQQNKRLLENALQFVQYNIRLLTDGFTKQLIDAKV
ncbi:MAG: flagellar protein FlgN [Bacteroidetes bacterium]|nr:flagellar protein FlgN [Bacteroidota bacterium]